MTGKKGDRIVVESETVGQPTREGKILEVTKGEAGVRYRVALAERIGERARSRLFEMCRVVRMPAVGDYRLPGR